MGLAEQLKPTILVAADANASAAAVLRDIAVEPGSWVCWQSPSNNEWQAVPAAQVVELLQDVEPESPVLAVVGQLTASVATADAKSVGSVFRAKRILSDDPARELLLLRRGRPAGLFKEATASGGHVDLSSPRQWITDMPDDETLFRSQVLFMGSQPKLRTRIAIDTSLGNPDALMIPAATLVDRKVQFEVTGINVQLITESGDHVDRATSELVDPLTDDAAFEVKLHPLAPGNAWVDLDIIFDDGDVKSAKTLEFMVIGDPTAQLPEAKRGSTLTETFTAPPEAAVTIAWENQNEYTLQWLHDGVPRPHGIAASRGAVEGPELIDLLGRVEGLAHNYRAHPDDVMALSNSDDALLAFAQVGAALHAFVFGADQYDVDATTFERACEIASIGQGGVAHRLKVRDDHVGLPWGLFYDAGYLDGDAARRFPTSADQVDERGFWGYRFRIDHQIARGTSNESDTSHVLARGKPTLVPFVNETIVDDANVSAELVERNDALLQTQGEWANVAPRTTELVPWLQTNAESHVIYVFGHGEAASHLTNRGLPTREAAVDQATLTIGAESLSVADLRAAEPRPPLLAGSPLVFLNACKTLEGDLLYSNAFIDLFYKRWHARAVVGGVASLPGRFAVGFADRFFSSFLSSSEQAGRVLHQTVRDLLDNENPYGLFYALYGRSELQVRTALQS